MIGDVEIIEYVDHPPGLCLPIPDFVEDMPVTSETIERKSPRPTEQSGSRGERRKAVDEVAAIALAPLGDASIRFGQAGLDRSTGASVQGDARQQMPADIQCGLPIVAGDCESVS